MIHHSISGICGDRIGSGTAQPAGDATERPRGEAQAAEQAPRLRRRRRTSARSGNQSEETRRKAS